MTGATKLTTSPPAFLHLEPRPVLRPWGGRRIAQRFGWNAEQAIGEWWLASSYPGTETSLRDGSGDLAHWLDAVGVECGCPGAADFPVLLKFLDAEQVLSLQVHPNDEVAARHGLPNGKTEAWHVLDADHNASVFLGTAPGVSCQQLLDRIEDGASDDEVRSLMNRLSVAPGDTIYVEAGTIHAIDGGISLFEVQQNSDATYRIHDWGRGRDVHLAQTRDAMIDCPTPSAIRPAVGNEWTELLNTPAFQLHRANPHFTLDVDPQGPYALLTVLSGEGEIQAGARDGKGAKAELKPGETLLVFELAELRGSGLDVLLVRPGE